MKISTDSFALNIRRIILERSYKANVGHIGSSLSITDIIAALYSNVLNITSARDLDRDRFVLSKGHAALAVYAALYLKGIISEEELNSFSSNTGTLLGVHPEFAVNGIDFCTGSLGQGITYAVGAALAARLQKSKRLTFVLVSDAECNEGSLWEAAAFAAHHKLSSLVTILDLNGQQALGYTHQVVNMEPMAERWKSFGWQTHEVDGHSTSEITNVIKALNTLDGPPHVLIAHTVFGKGVPFMENQIKWHYWPMSPEEYRLAKESIGVPL